MNERLMQMLLVGAGGFLGANARYLLGILATAHLGTRFPFATVFINVSGSFLLGLVGTLAAERWIPNPEPFRLLLGVGFLGPSAGSPTPSPSACCWGSASWGPSPPSRPSNTRTTP